VRTYRFLTSAYSSHRDRPPHRLTVEQKNTAGRARRRPTTAAVTDQQNVKPDGLDAHLA
jgi:hypothetical protein